MGSLLPSFLAGRSLKDAMAAPNTRRADVRPRERRHFATGLGCLTQVSLRADSSALRIDAMALFC